MRRTFSKVCSTMFYQFKVFVPFYIVSTIVLPNYLLNVVARTALLSLNL